MTTKNKSAAHYDDQADDFDCLIARSSVITKRHAADEEFAEFGKLAESKVTNEQRLQAKRFQIKFQREDKLISGKR